MSWTLSFLVKILTSDKRHLRLSSVDSILFYGLVSIAINAATLAIVFNGPLGASSLHALFGAVASVLKHRHVSRHTLSSAFTLLATTAAIYFLRLICVTAGLVALAFGLGILIAFLRHRSVIKHWITRVAYSLVRSKDQQSDGQMHPEGAHNAQSKH